SDTKATCFVNPSHPEQAVLEKSTLWIGFIILFPLVFVGIGAGGMLANWGFQSIPAWFASRSLSRRAATSDGRGRSAVSFQVVFFSFFLLVGAGGLYLLT